MKNLISFILAFAITCFVFSIPSAFAAFHESPLPAPLPEVSEIPQFDPTLAPLYDYSDYDDLIIAIILEPWPPRMEVLDQWLDILEYFIKGGSLDVEDLREMLEEFIAMINELPNDAPGKVETLERATNLLNQLR